jgi:hypothetical protein
MIITARCPSFALIDAEKYMPLIVTHKKYFRSGGMNIIPERMSISMADGYVGEV